MARAEPAAPCILVRDPGERPVEWRRFVAALCFIEFYAYFVHHGRDLALHYYDPNTGSLLNAEAVPWPTLAALFRAITLYLLGRCLWYGRRSLWVWLTVAGAASLLDLVSASYRALHDIRWILWPGITLPLAPLRILLVSLAQLPWLAMLLVGGWHVRYCRHPRSRSWVIFAAIWSAGMTLFSFDYAYFTPNPTGRGLVGFLPQPWLVVPCQLTSVVVAGLLLAHWAYVRTAALVLGMMETIYCIFGTFHLMWLVAIAIKALFIATNVDAPVWKNIVFSQYAFTRIFVYVVANAGPWFLIAWYVWRVPMKALPDDGSPYPRRYCGKCFYNLHGIDTATCPECGAALISPAPQIERRRCSARRRSLKCVCPAFSLLASRSMPIAESSLTKRSQKPRFQ